MQLVDRGTKAVGGSAAADVDAGPTIVPDPVDAPRQRWRLARRAAAAAIGLAFAVIPIGAATAFALIAGRLLAPPESDGARVAWWAAVFVLSAIAAWGADRLVRRLFPLVGLLRVALVLPGDVESRLGLALRAGTVRDLGRGVIDLRDDRVDAKTEAAVRIVALAGSLQRHDRFTRGHSERVRAYTDLIAAELGLSKHDRERLRWAALLHDIGKLEVRPALLNKPAGLTDSEWLEMRRHPVEGARIAEPLRPWLGDWTDAVGQHHERFDGTGYPRGLQATDIALAGRIVAVADSYETMTATRPYKKPMPHQQARQELVAQAGAHFDPAVVRAMLNLSTRKVRWAAGPFAAIGDSIASTLIAHIGPVSGPLLPGTGLLPWAGGAAAVMAAVSVALLPPQVAEVTEFPAPPTAVVANNPAGVTGSTTTTATSSTPAPLADGGSGRGTAGAPMGGAPVESPADVTSDVPTRPPGTSPPLASTSQRETVDVPPIPFVDVPELPVVPAVPAVPGVGPGSRAIPATPAIPANGNGNGNGDDDDHGNG